MKSFLLSCPATRPGFEILAKSHPLALCPVLGRPLLDLVLADLAMRGFNSGIVITPRSAPLPASFLLGGKPWGLQLEVRTVRSELKPEALTAVQPEAEVFTLECLPGGRTPLWRKPADFFAALAAEMPRAALDRVGMAEVKPGVFVHRRARIAPDAHLTGPCWIGDGVSIGAGAEIGCGAIIEERCLIDEHATVSESVIGPDTYVGQLTEIRTSFAWGNQLLNWRTGSQVEVTDRFLLASLAKPAAAAAGWRPRLRRAWRSLVGVPSAARP